MPKQNKKSQVRDYRFDEKRKNNPPVGLAEYEKKEKKPLTKKYSYDPHLSPQLIWAGKPGLRTIEVDDIVGIETDTVSLHVHERVSAKAIINSVKRKDANTITIYGYSYNTVLASSNIVSVDCANGDATVISSKSSLSW